MKRFIFMIALIAYSNGVQCSNMSFNIDMNEAEGFESSQRTKIDLTRSLDDSKMSRTKQSISYPDINLFKDVSDDKVGHYTPIPNFDEVIPHKDARPFHKFENIS